MFFIQPTSNILMLVLVAYITQIFARQLATSPTQRDATGTFHRPTTAPEFTRSLDGI